MGAKLSNFLESLGVEAPASSLKHYGVKGMKWGKRSAAIVPAGGGGGEATPEQLKALTSALEKKDRTRFDIAVKTGATPGMNYGKFGYFMPKGKTADIMVGQAVAAGYRVTKKGDVFFVEANKPRAIVGTTGMAANKRKAPAGYSAKELIEQVRQRKS